MRGIGKTHTIALIYHRLQEQADLKDKLIIAWLKEEEWGVSSWLDLQISVFQALSILYPKEYKNKLAANIEALYQLSADEATIAGETILTEFIGNRTLLILTENLDEIFAGLKDKEQKKFRAYLQNHNPITIVATSQSLFNGVTSKKCPFYGFFNPQRLDKLSLTEATDLLTKIAQFKQDTELENFVRSQTGQDRIKAIHHLAAGNHRVYVIFSQFLTRDSLDELVQPVMQTLDELTPYYQARMQWLSPQQRKIIELLCDRRGAVPVKEIAQRCFISHQTASSQLKDLLKKGYVGKESQGRESFYELQEPLMRICLEAKKQRGEPIKLFIDFLRIWYTEDELKTRLQQLPRNCLEKQYILKALETKCLSNQHNISKNNSNLDFLIEKGLKKCKQKKFLDALVLFDRVLQSNEIKNIDRVIYFRAASLAGLSRYEEALKSVNEFLTKYSSDNHLWFVKGILLNRLKKYKESADSLEESVKIDDDNYSAWFLLACTQTLLHEYSKAVKAFNKAVKINPSPDRNIWNIYGIALYNSGKHKEAIEAFRKDIVNNPNNNSTWLYMGAALLIENQWQKGFEALENGLIFTKKLNKNDDGNAKLIISIIFNNKQKQSIWNKRLKILVQLYSKHGVVSKLGKGITEYIPNLISEMVSNQAARTWLEAWQKIAGDKLELDVPLRFLKTAVEYKEKKGDRRVLLQLSKEERDLFETLLEDKQE